MLITDYLLYNKGGGYTSTYIFGDSIVDELRIELPWEVLEELENFLRACKKVGDTTRQNVLKRLEFLKNRSRSRV